MIDHFLMGQMFAVLFMAFALGLDAFSLGLGMGMRGMRLMGILMLSLVIGLFHVIMPLIGMFMGNYVSSLIGHIATSAGGTLLVLLGAHMVYSSLRGERAPRFDTASFWGVVLFALSVSVDSFSVGVSMGLFASDVIFTVLSFGIVGGLMSIVGLLLGKRLRSWVGEYGEAFGGIILLSFGIKILF